MLIQKHQNVHPDTSTLNLNNDAPALEKIQFINKMTRKINTFMPPPPPQNQKEEKSPSILPFSFLYYVFKKCNSKLNSWKFAKPTGDTWHQALVRTQSFFFFFF